MVFDAWRRRLRGKRAQQSGRRREKLPGQRRDYAAALVAVELENRTLLTGTNAASVVSALWFQDVASATPQPQAGQGGNGQGGQGNGASTQSWIVQFDQQASSSLKSVADTQSFLSDAPADFRIVKGLGAEGQVLIETWGASEATFASWFAANPYITSFEEDLLIQSSVVSNDPSFGSLWGLENTGQSGGTVDADIDATAAWNLTTGSSSVIVAVIDSGIDYNHPDLAANIWTNPGEIAGDGIDNDQNGFIDDIHGWDFANYDSNPMDDNGHGTHVAGTIGAVGNNARGVVGVNWNVQLMALKFLDNTGNGYISRAVEATNYATMMRERGENVRVTNNSWGGGGYTPGLASAIAAARDEGILYIAAAGNGGSDQIGDNIDTSVFYPASYNVENVIAVAATTRTDAIASYSNYGINTVDLAAPGSSVYSTLPNNSYGTYSGTSMATPHVSGVAALAWSLMPDASWQEVRGAILSGVDKLSSLATKVATGGRLNAAGTLNYLVSHAPATPSSYLAKPTTFESIDLAAGAPGVISVLDAVDDGSTAMNLAGNTFTFYGTTYSGVSSLFVSDNGLITFGSGSNLSANDDLGSTPAFPAIAPYWADLRTDLTSSDRVLARFDDLTGDGIADRLVIEWSDVRYYPASSSPGTFQAILQLNTGAVDGSIIFNYVDVDFGDTTINDGATATIGVRPAGTTGDGKLLLQTYNNYSGLVSSGQAILVDRTRPSADIVDVSPDPRPDGVASIDVQFTEAIDPTTFDYRDLILKRDNGTNLITSAVTVTQLTETTWRIGGFANLTSAYGTYVLSVDLGGVADQLGHRGQGTVTETWIAKQTLPDIKMLSATANGLTTLTVTYEITTLPVAAFDLGIYLSADSTFGGDTLLQTLSLTDLADLSVGLHTKSWTIGSGAGKVALPGAGGTELTTDYSLLFVADPANSIAEFDTSLPGEDNVALFSGVYHAAGSNVMVHGTESADTVTTSGSSTVTLAFNGTNYIYSISDINSLRVRTRGGNDVVNGTTFTKGIFALGGAGNDTLTGGSAADIFSGGDGDDSLTGNSGDDRLSGDAGNDTLAGKDGNDTYAFAADSALGSDVLSEASTSTETLDFSGTLAEGVSVNLSLATAQVVNSYLTLTLGSGSPFENVLGGNGADTLIGNALNNRLTGGAGNDTLQGLTGNDTYVFDADSSLGVDAVVEAAGGGTDNLDFSATTTRSIVANLAWTSLQEINDNLYLTLSAGDTFEYLAGGAMGDTIFGNSLANVLTGGEGNDSIDGGLGNDVLDGGGGTDVLFGGEGDDTFRFDADTALGSDFIVENAASAGIDTLDFSLTTTRAIALNLTNAAAQVVNGALTVTLSDPGAFENITGGGLSDSLQGNELANRLIGGAGNDVLDGRGGSDLLSGDAGNDTLNGGADSDVYQFDTDVALGTDSIVESDGLDRLDFSLTTTRAVSVDLSNAASQLVNGGLTLLLNSGAAIEEVTGGSLNDVLRGNALANALRGGAGNDVLSGLAGDDTLVGGAGNDTYTFAADTQLGSDTIDETGGGSDTLDFSSTLASSLRVNLSQATSQLVHANLSLTLGSATTLENVIGGAAADTLTGNTLANQLTGGGGNDLLAGGAGNDSYLFAADVALGSDLLIEAAGSGTDTVDFSPTTTQGVTLDLSSALAQVVNGNLSLTLSAPQEFENLTGGGGADTLSGNSLANVLQGSGGNDSLFGNAGNDTLIGGAGNDALAGQDGNDIYQFDGDSALGSDTLSELATGGTDTLDFSLTTTLGVTLDLQLTSAQVLNSNLMLTLSSNAAFENATGSALADIILGNDSDNRLLGGAGNDALGGRGGNDSLAGEAGNDTLDGSAGDDTYLFDADSALGSDTLMELAGLGNDLLDFSATTGRGVVIDLATTALQVVNSNLSLTLSSTAGFEMVFGTIVADTIRGNSLNNVLIGSNGNDTLQGFAGRDLLIGGNAKDTIYGGADDDLLISGTVGVYSETNGTLNRAAIDAIMAEWTRLDADYATRLLHLRSGGGLNGATLLTAANVFNDSSAVDSLFGEAGLDWFWRFTGDVVNDQNIAGGELLN